MKISTQLFIGAREKEDFSIDYLRQRIASAKKYVNLQNLMIWADDDPTTYQRIVNICHDYDIKSYLWFPVLADVPGYAIQEDDLVASYTNTRGYGQIGLWEQLGQSDEKFLFLCPNNHPALDGVFQIYKDLLDQVDFDGVFLDKIRYPSCSNGFESLFTCFCDFCQNKFSDRYGPSLEPSRQALVALVERLKRITARQLEGYDRLELLWKSADLEDFFEFRTHNIHDLVRRFSEYARSHRKLVGLDLYTPSLAPFVSQDYRQLSDCCDWIKPMSYCHVIGPAGVPLEISCLIRAMSVLCPDISDHTLIRFFERVLGVRLPESTAAILARGLPEEFVAKEVEKISKLLGADAIPIYPGIEAVKNPHFSLNIDKNMLENYLAHIQQRVPGFIASWNVLYIPDENLAIMGNYEAH